MYEVSISLSIHHLSMGRVSPAEEILDFFPRGSPKYSSTSKISFRTIRQVDPNFTQDNFVRFLEKEMIPIVLEAAAMNDQEVVEDWALDAPSQKLLLSHNAAKKGNTLVLSRIPTVKLKIPGKSMGKSECRTSVTFKLKFFTLVQIHY